MNEPCDHVWLPHDDEGFFCPECGEKRDHRPAPWEPGGRFPSVRADIRPHFNFSAGVPIRSRRELAEVCKRQGLRPVDPDLRHEDRAREEIDRLDKNNLKKIQNPRRPLKHYYEEQIAHA